MSDEREKALQEIYRMGDKMEKALQEIYKIVAHASLDNKRLTKDEMLVIMMWCSDGLEINWAQPELS